MTVVHFEEGPLESPVLLLRRLGQGHEVAGPAVIMDGLSTLLVEPGCRALVTSRGDLSVEVGDPATKPELGQTLDAVQLSIFSHRFMSIAEQMGRSVKIGAGIGLSIQNYVF